MLFDNTILFALMTYGLALVIALIVASIITIIGRAVKAGANKASKE